MGNINRRLGVYRHWVSIFLMLAGSYLFSITSLCSGEVESATIKQTPAIGAYVYTELQLSLPFEQVPWYEINKNIRAQPGFINKTWLAGAGNQSAGGFYAFDSIENARHFVTHYFAAEAKGFGVAHTTKIFDAKATEQASADINSVYWRGILTSAPKAFVYVELQFAALDFEKNIPWRKRNKILRRNSNLLSKTWLSEVDSGVIGGFYAFDSFDAAKNFALTDIPARAKVLNVAMTTRIFDATITEQASIAMGSPFYALKIL